MAGKVKLTDSLLKRAHHIAIQHSALNHKLTKAFEQRYGCTYSDVDCDSIIDSLDYGHGPPVTVEFCDSAMLACGRAHLVSSGKGE